MMSYGGVDVKNIFLTSALARAESSASGHGRFTPGERAPVPIGWEVGWIPELAWKTWRSENSCPHLGSNSDPLVVRPIDDNDDDDDDNPS
jgi:hypothetical protein